MGFPRFFRLLPFLLLHIFHTRCTYEWGREEKVVLCGREHLKRVIGLHKTNFFSLLLSNLPGKRHADPSIRQAFFSINTKYIYISDSHRPRPHHHQHDRLLALRPLQPRNQPGVERDVFRGHSPEPGRWGFQSHVWGQPVREGSRKRGGERRGQMDGRRKEGGRKRGEGVYDMPT